MNRYDLYFILGFGLVVVTVLFILTILIAGVIVWLVERKWNDKS